MPNPLRNARHEAFCQHLARGKTLKSAYEMAGFKRSNGRAGQLSKEPQIRKRIAEIAKELNKTIPSYRNLAEIDHAASVRLARRLEQSKEGLARELACIAGANMRDFVRIETDEKTGISQAIVDLTNVTREQWGAVRSLTIDTLPTGNVIRTRIMLHDKIAAASQISRMFGWIMDKPEGTTPLEQRLAQMTPEQREADARELAARIRARLDMDAQERMGGIGQATDAEEEPSE